MGLLRDVLGNSRQIWRTVGSNNTTRPTAWPRWRGMSAKTPGNGGSSWTRGGRRGRGVAVGMVATTSMVAVPLIMEFGDVPLDPRYHAMALARVSRVAVATVKCMGDYHSTMTKEYGNDEDYYNAMSECHLRCAKRTLKVLEENGGIYIKLGQHLSAMAYLIPMEWVDTMKVLQDRCPSSTIESLKAMFEEETGQPFDDYFSYFNEKPIGVASLAQVHEAVLKSGGQRVAVKLQHPSIQDFVAIDIQTTRSIFVIIKQLFPDFSFIWLSEEMEVSLPQELDFRQEANNAERTAVHFKKIGQNVLKIPEVYKAHRRVLVMEYIEGSRLDDKDYLIKHHINKNDVSLELSRIFNEMIFGKDGHLHCDPHGGNLFIRPKPVGSKSARNFEIVLLDHGLYRQIPRDLRHSYARLWMAIINADEDGMRKYAWEAAGIPENKYRMFASAITGRDWGTLKTDISSQRDSEEFDRIKESMKQGLLLQIIQMLSDVPKIFLLLFKTNDLVRALDESLGTTTGARRTFVVMARYCLQSIFEDDLDKAYSQSAFKKPVAIISAYFQYYRKEPLYAAYEHYLTWKGHMKEYFMTEEYA